jgi:hypothetical protein
MVASLNGKYTLGVRKGSLFDVFYPCAIYTDWKFVFLLASHSAGMTADAFAVIDDETVIH